MWDPLRARPRRDDVVAVALPGFGDPAPDGFGATKEEYADWLDRAGRARSASRWTSSATTGVPSSCSGSRRPHPELIRTLACGGGPVDRTYEWHAMAQLWQTPGAGEEIVAGMVAMAPADLAAGLAAGGRRPSSRRGRPSASTRRMADCILALYRSAVTVGDEWEDAVAAMPRAPVARAVGSRRPVRRARRWANDSRTRSTRSSSCSTTARTGGRGSARRDRGRARAALGARRRSAAPRARYLPDGLRRDLGVAASSLQRRVPRGAADPSAELRALTRERRPRCTRSRARSSRAASRCRRARPCAPPGRACTASGSSSRRRRRRRPCRCRARR